VRYDRPFPRVMINRGQRRTLTWAGIFANNGGRPTPTDELVELVRRFVEDEIADRDVLATGRTLLRELGVIA
jgi:hypothetical protein